MPNPLRSQFSVETVDSWLPKTAFLFVLNDNRAQPQRQKMVRDADLISPDPGISGLVIASASEAIYSRGAKKAWTASELAMTNYTQGTYRSSFRDAPLGAGPESILPIVVMDSGFSPAGCPGMTMMMAIDSFSNSQVVIKFQTHLRILATPRARAVQEFRPSKKQRAQGKPGARCTRSLACKMKKHTSGVTTGSPEKPGLPCAMVLTVSFALSLVTGLVCHHRRRNAQALSPT
jgi:hypothetical protein